MRQRFVPSTCSNMTTSERHTPTGKHVDLQPSPSQGAVGQSEIDHVTENRLRNLVEAAGDMVWTVDMSMQPTYVSASVQQHLGYTREEAMKQPMHKVFAPHSYRLAMEALSAELERDSVLDTPADRTRTFELDLFHKDGHVVPVEICYSALRDATGAPTEIMAVARNISERIRIQHENRAQTEKLIAALQQTVQSLAMLLEMRDSYTAGHQRRVADLACAIARRLGLSADVTQGLQLAGLIHDIGKVRVPAEILNSTRHLCSAEFEIIKMHPTTGYLVLRGIDFPWPIAEAVYQHHERIDGTGYPQGLSGDDITFESRILAVADVVEAIASSRPYRHALGVECALDEISVEKGIRYDRDVVDACIKVFHNDLYMFADQGTAMPGDY